MLIIRTITVDYQLRVPADRREEAQRVHGFHARFCPVARSLDGAIKIRTQLKLLE